MAENAIELEWTTRQYVFTEVISAVFAVSGAATPLCEFFVFPYAKCAVNYQRS
jgi:hypothetical protein